MNKPNRLATGDKVEIIDRESEYYGKTGEVKEVGIRTIELINTRRKQIIKYAKVTLDDTGTTVEFTLNQLRRI